MAGEVQIPGWFQQAMLMLGGKYPSFVQSKAAVLGYWDELSDLPQEAVQRAMRQAPTRHSERDGRREFCPSAPFVREIAQSIAKTLGPKPDYSRPALPEPEPDLDPELRERMEHVRRTYSGRDLPREMIKLVLEYLP